MVKFISDNYNVRNNKVGVVFIIVKYKYSKIKDYDSNKVFINIQFILIVSRKDFIYCI